MTAPHRKPRRTEWTTGLAGTGRTAVCGRITAVRASVGARGRSISDVRQFLLSLALSEAVSWSVEHGLHPPFGSLSLWGRYLVGRARFGCWSSVVSTPPPGSLCSRWRRYRYVSVERCLVVGRPWSPLRPLEASLSLEEDPCRSSDEVLIGRAWSPLHPRKRLLSLGGDLSVERGCTCRSSKGALVGRAWSPLHPSAASALSPETLSVG